MGRFECNMCEESFTTKSKLTKHLLSHNEEKHEYTLCEQKFSQKGQLEQHKSNRHNGERESRRSSKLSTQREKSP